MEGRGYLVGGLATAAVVVTLVVASVSSGTLMGPSPLPRATRRGPPLEQPPGPPTGHTGADGPLLPRWVVLVLSMFLLLYALGILFVIVKSQWGRRARARPENLADVDLTEEPWRALLAVELSDAADQQLYEISHGEPRNAIVACWLRLQGATQGVGLPAVPSETAQEFTVRALTWLSLDATAIATLSDLYREARFSEHVMAEPHRERARAALAILADQLRQEHVEAEANS